MKSFSQQLAISTSCLGLHPTHSLDAKLHAAVNHGFSGVEIVFGDLERYSEANKLSMTEAAEKIQQTCKELGLHVLSLCPLENFEGSKIPLEERLLNAEEWVTVARLLKATHIQVPAQYNQDASTNEDVIVSELQQLADLAAANGPAIRVTYEPMAWSICYPTWESALALSELVNRPNFGICLDSFHIASMLWGSPSEPSGKYPNADQTLADSMHRFVREFPVEKLFYIQLSDGEKFDPLYSTSHPWYIEGEAPQFTWSKHARPFPLETELGGYMPIVEIARSLTLDKGFHGWISLETFDRRMRDETFTPENGARRAEISIQRLEQALNSPRAGL